MGNALCLKCSHFVLKVNVWSDGKVRHPSMTNGCSLLLHPKEGKDGQGNVVADYCEEYKVR